ITPDIIPYSKRLKMLGRLTSVQIDQPSPLPENFSSIQTIDLLHLLSYVFHVPNTPSWTGFNSRIIEDNSPTQKVSYLTPINLSPTNVSVVAYTMEQAQNVGKECGQTYVQVTYDLAIAKIAYKIQAREGLKFSNLFIHLGSFHLMMAFFKAVGTFINECGLSHMMIESKIVASGSVNGILEDKHFNRCKRLHPLMALGLQILHFDEFLKSKNAEHDFVKGQIYEDLLEYQNKKIS
ncbi:GSCOCG00012410001-RA-CDS, partial [Cotesia congregata]